MIQLVSPPQTLVQMVIPQLLCFSVYNEGNTTKQLEDWIEEIHRQYHIQELTKPTDPISISQAQLNHTIDLNRKVEDRNPHLEKQVQDVIDNNQRLEKELLKLQNNISTINSVLEQEVEEMLKKLPSETADLIVQVVTLNLEHQECQSAVKDDRKEVDDLNKRDNTIQELAEDTRNKEEKLKELLKTKNRELEDAEKEAGNLEKQLNLIPELLNLKPKERDQLLLNATEQGNVTVVKSLLELGANTSERDDLGSTPLLRASYNGNLEIAQLLIDSGADLEDKDEFGNTPLFWATLNSHFEICKMLLDNGANVNARSESGGTALHLAAFYGDLSIAKLLVERGADINVVDDNGRTPREDAIANDKVNVADFLSKHAT